MHSLFQFVIRCVVIVSLASATLAQDKREADDRRTTVTAFASTERVRFTAPASVVQMHLEVYSEIAIKLFDFELKGGNVLDWHLQNGQAERLGAGAYLCVVTVKNLAGKITQKLGTVTIAEQQVTVEPVQSAELKPQQAQAIGPLEADASLTVLREGEAVSGTVIAHNGAEGQINRSQGALTFRLGDLFSGKDSEQMRLTADGKLGIGVSDPQAKLDVAGPIRTSEGIVFPDGSIQTTAYVASGHSLSARAGLQRDAQSRSLAEPNDQAVRSEKGLRLTPNIGGTGTGGQLAKWAAANGTATDQLGNSVVTELNGNLGIGTTNPTAQIHASRGDGSYQYKMERTGANAHTYGFGADSNGNFFLDDVTSAVRRLSLVTNGNIGIGTSAPANKLDVFGGIRAYFSSSTGMVAETLGGTNSWARFHMNTPSQRWFIGTSNNFNGNQFYLVDDTNGQTRLTIQPGGGIISIPLGQVYIGASPPLPGKLSVVTDVFQGVYAQSNSGAGVYGVSDTSDGVSGYSSNGNGVGGYSASRIGVYGYSGSVEGVYGTSSSNLGVHGVSTSGTGVAGDSDSGTGVFGQSKSGYAGVFLGNVVISGTVTQSFEPQLKQSVLNLGYGLPEVLRLRPVSWHSKDQPERGPQLGLIAQEVEALLPELVTTDKTVTQTKGVNYIGLLPVIIKAIQEQQVTITTLKDANAALQQQKAALETRLTALEQMMQELKGSREQGRQQSPKEQP